LNSGGSSHAQKLTHVLAGFKADIFDLAVELGGSYSYDIVLEPKFLATAATESISRGQHQASPHVPEVVREHAPAARLKWTRDQPGHETCPSSHVARRTHGSPAYTNPSLAGTRMRSILAGFPQVRHVGTMRRTLGPITVVV